MEVTKTKFGALVASTAAIAYGVYRYRSSTTTTTTGNIEANEYN
jgi:hypothetical protein